MDKKNKGSITVFLSLILFLVLAFVGTMLEGVRLHMIKGYAERSLFMGMDNVLSQYYRPLYEDYHLFFVEKGLQENDEKKVIENEIKDCMQVAFLPYNEIMQEGEKKTLKGVHLLESQVSNLKIQSMTRAVDFNGEIFSNEAIEYMKYKGVEGGAKKVLENLNIFETSQKTTDFLEDTPKIEKDIKSLSQDVLKLIKIVEGISVNKKNALVSYNNFAKKLTTTDFTADNLGINNLMVWNVLKEEYRNPVKMLEEMKKKIQLLQNNIDSKAQLKKLIKEYKACRKRYIDVINQTTYNVKMAIEVIDRLKIKQGQCKKNYLYYNEELVKKKDGLSKEGYKVLSEHSEEMKKYIFNEIDKVIGMKSYLEKNLYILENGKKVPLLHMELDAVTLKEIITQLETRIMPWKEYSIKELNFNYSHFVKEKEEDPRDVIKGINKDDILDWVIEEKVKISSASLEESDILYQKYKNNEKNTLIKDCSINKILLNEYYVQHFKNFINNLEEKKKETKLEYEQEYLLIGKRDDVGNLKGIVNRILGVRTTLNLMYVLTDSEKKAEAYGMAMGIVGFTGLEPIVRLTQISLLLTLSYEEAILDTAGLLKGKKVDLIKTKQNFQLGLSDMFLFSKKLIKTKVEKIKESKNILSFSYTDYIRTFLLLENKNKIIYRSMDMIEANIRKRYKNQFSMERCIYGFKAMAEIEVVPKFLHILSNGYFSTLKTSWKISLEQSNAY